MLNGGDLKNKYIQIEDGKYRPYVEWFEWPVWSLPLCDELTDAQAMLALFPPDCWDGYLSTLEYENEPRVLEKSDDFVCDLPSGEREGRVQEVD